MGPHDVAHTPDCLEEAKAAIHRTCRKRQIAPVEELEAVRRLDERERLFDPAQDGHGAEGKP